MAHNSNSGKKNGSSSGSTAGSWFWTNERHVHFLNSIEATFVRTMFQNQGHHALRLRLDRQLPDSSESTQDLGVERPWRQCHSTPDVGEYSSSSLKRTDWTNKIFSSHHYDQVVPQLQSRVDDVDVPV